jgi:hypothetical protein
MPKTLDGGAGRWVEACGETQPTQLMVGAKRRKAGVGYGTITVRRQEGFSTICKSITIQEEKVSEEELKYQRAQKRVEAIKGFYIHLGVYLLVNLLLFLINILTSQDDLWFYWVLLGWGIAVVAHAFSVFGFGRLLGSDWEEKKIREIMEEEEKD